MSIDGIGTTSFSNVHDIGAGEQFLSNDALIIQLQAQMTSLDGEIKNLTGLQKTDLARKAALNEAYTAGMKHNPPTNQAEWDANINGMWKAASELPANDPARKVIEARVAEVQREYCKGLSTNPRYPDAEKGDWANQMQSLKTEVEKINGNAELRMISIQDLMSKRQTAVQLTTSIIQKMNATTEAITQKI